MERNIVYRLFLFIKDSYQTRLKESISGIIMGGSFGYGIFFAHVPDSLIHTWIGVWLWLKTIFFALTSSVATAYGAYLIEKYKNKTKKPSAKKKKKTA